MLCRAAAHGNQIAYSELYLRHGSALRAFVFHFLGARHRHEDAEDVVQDAFERAFEAIAAQHFEGDFKRWLFAIARNRSIDLLRGERVRLVPLESDDAGSPAQIAAEHSTPSAQAETREEITWLVAEIEHLPERQRSALLLRELAGLSHEAIAEELDTTVGAARQLITRAREGVRGAAVRDGREDPVARERSLRKELLDSVPMVPLAAAGIVVSAGSSTAGSLAFGNLVATVFAALVFAGTAGTISREISEASGAPGRAERAPSAQYGYSADGKVRSAPNGDGQAPETRSNAHFSDFGPSEKKPAASVPKPADTRNDSEGSRNEDPGNRNEDPGNPEPGGERQPTSAAPASPDPVKEVVDLPGKVIENVTGGLNGSTPPAQAVGDTVGDVLGTIGNVTTGILGSGSGAH